VAARDPEFWIKEGMAQGVKYVQTSPLTYTGIHIKGLEEIRQNLEVTKGVLRLAANRTMAVFFRQLTLQSRGPIAGQPGGEVPVATGELSKAYYVMPMAGGSADSPRQWEAGYRTDDVFYAWAVHDREDLQHTPPTKWRFLADPWETLKPTFDRRLNQEIARSIAKFVGKISVPPPPRQDEPETILPTSSSNLPLISRARADEMLLGFRPSQRAAALTMLQSKFRIKD
jgi:hypothetical protein